MNYQSLAFFTGLFGSLHCVVMCGPLVMSVPFTGSIWFSLLQKFIYQIGRILTYSLLGFVAGSVGSLFNILGLQQILSFVSGVLLILIAIYHFSGHKRTPNKTYLKLIGPLAKFLGRWMSKPYGGFVAGSLHGFIPCGMVYMAVAGSLNTGSAFAGSEFMLYFGLGTTPLSDAYNIYSGCDAAVSRTAGTDSSAIFSCWYTSYKPFNKPSDSLCISSRIVNHLGARLQLIL